MSREVLQKYQIRAKKALGQNFLVNEGIVEEISHVVEVQGENIIEVGPGYGALTEKLIEQNPSSLNLVELDKDMITILEDRISNKDFDISKIDFAINNIDVLKYYPSYDKYSVIANIPYYITSPILRHFLYEVENKPESMVILMQDDVGQKILGKGKNKSSVLSLFIEKKCSVSEVIKVPGVNFVPAPKVESSVLLFELHNDYSEVEDNKFLKVIKIGFAEPRKKLIKNLVKGGYDKDLLLGIFKQLNIGENARGEELSIELWLELVSKI